MLLTDVQINLGIFTKTLVCDHSPHLPPSSSNQFNSKLQISRSILSHSESIINSSQLFMSPFSADTLRNCPFRLLNHCDCYKFTATPCVLNMHLECWPPAAISLRLCLSFTQITQVFWIFFLTTYSLFLIYILQTHGKQQSLRLTLTQLIDSFISE